MAINLLENIREFIKKSFVRDTAILQVGSLISILLSVASSVVFARILQPANYGIYSLIFSLSALICLFMKMGAIQATETLLSGAWARKDKSEIKKILTYFLKITAPIFLLVGAFGIYLLPVLSELLYQKVQIGSMARVVLLAEIIVFFFSFTVIILQVLRKIKQLVILESLNRLLKFILMFVLLILGFGLSGLVTGYLIAIVIIVIISVLWYRQIVKKYEYLPSFFELFANFGKVCIKKYFVFGIKIAASKNLAQLFSLLPVLFLGVFVSFQEVAFFKIAFGYMSIPLVILTPVSRLLSVQLPKSKVYGFQYLKSHFIKTSLYSGLISLAMVLPFVLLAPFLVKLFYGYEYIPSVRLIYYLSIYAALVGFGVGLGPIFRTLDRMGVVIIVNVFVLLIGSLFGYFFINEMGVVGGCLMVILMSILSNFTLLFLSLRVINNKVKYGHNKIKYGQKNSVD